MIAQLIDTLVDPARRDSRAAKKRADDRTCHIDYVALVDRTILTVPQGNLAAAKSVLAAQKMAERQRTIGALTGERP